MSDRATIRRLEVGDLPKLLRLYGFLHPEDPLLDATVVREHGELIFSDEKFRYYGAEAEGRLVSTCTLAVIPNLTRDLRPYGVIENVVTDPEFRCRGFGQAILRYALTEAWESGCYKVMLATGSKLDGTLRFYEGAGFRSGVKTGFVAYPG